MINLKEINKIVDLAYKLDKVRFNLFENLVNYPELTQKDYNSLFRDYTGLQELTNKLISLSWDLYNAYYGNFEYIGKNETNINRNSVK